MISISNSKLLISLAFHSVAIARNTRKAFPASIHATPVGKVSPVSAIRANTKIALIGKQERKMFQAHYCSFFDLTTPGFAHFTIL